MNPTGDFQPKVHVRAVNVDGVCVFKSSGATAGIQLGASNPAELQNEIQRLKGEFSGLGLLDCGGVLSTAQLTGANNVITFAVHTQFGPNCEDYTKRKGRCTFKPVFIEHPAVTVEFKSILSRCDMQNRRIDWAVAKLEQPINAARYFKVPEKDVRWRRRTELIQVSARHKRNFRNGNKSPTIQRCIVRVTYNLCNQCRRRAGPGHTSNKIMTSIRLRKESTLRSPSPANSAWRSLRPSVPSKLTSLRDQAIA